MYIQNLFVNLHKKKKANNLTNKKMKTESELLLELTNAIENGYVVVNMNGEEFLMIEQEEQDFQVFCQSNVKLNNGWLNPDGTPENNVEVGQYYMCDDNGIWELVDAVWCKNVDCGTPYVLSDFRYNGSFFEFIY